MGSQNCCSHNRVKTKRNRSDDFVVAADTRSRPKNPAALGSLLTRLAVRTTGEQRKEARPSIEAARGCSAGVGLGVKLLQAHGDNASFPIVEI